MKGLRGTAFDVFGYAEVRRLERTLIGEYRQLLETVLVRLSPVTHDAAVTIAELPDEVRGYEQIKIDNVARFREKAKQLIAQLN
jgi:indolepyruvate ferredoxin oxidoreductase